ncbi:hypothetical protein TNCV_825201 [Trichonephila clavipes]|nr:hypothetical protein TNCV_825201 [Trichonephila clavipes]
MKRMDNNSESSKGVSNADVVSALETAMELYEEQSECCPTQLLLLKRIRETPCSEKNEGLQCLRALTPTSIIPSQKATLLTLTASGFGWKEFAFFGSKEPKRTINGKRDGPVTKVGRNLLLQCHLIGKCQIEAYEIHHGKGLSDACS